jgi:hypothetical protein
VKGGPLVKIMPVTPDEIRGDEKRYPIVLCIFANDLLILLVPGKISTSLSLFVGYPSIQLLREVSEIFGNAS